MTRLPWSGSLRLYMATTKKTLSDFDVGDYIDVLVDGAWKPARWTCTTWKWCHHVNVLAEDGSEIVTDTVLDGKTPARKRRR